MELHDLEQAWHGLDQRLAEQDARLRELHYRQGVQSARNRLHRVSLGQLVQLAVGIVIVLWAGGYWVGKLGTTHLVVYGIAIHVWGLALAVSAGVQLARIARISPRQPVVEVQRELLALRRLRIRSERVLLVLGFVIWVPVMLVLANAAGLDLWQRSPGNVLFNLAVGIGLAALAAWWTHRYRERFERDATGRSLRAAEQELADLGPD